MNRARPLAQRPYELVGVGRHLEHVVRGHAVAAERLAQALDAVPVQLDAGRGDQDAVGDPLPVLQHHLVALGFEAGRRGPDPPHLARHHLRHSAFRLAAIEHAAADEGPARLVVVALPRLDDRDGQPGPALEQAGGRGDAGRAAADDHDIVGRSGTQGHDIAGLRHVVGSNRSVGAAPLLQPRPQAFEVVARLGRGLEDGIGIEVPGFGQGPQGGGAGAGPAEGQHGPPHFAQRLRESFGILVRDLAGHYRDVPVGEPQALGRRREGFAARLVLGLSIGAVVDDGLEPLGRRDPEVLFGELVRDRQKGSDLRELHGTMPRRLGKARRLARPAPWTGQTTSSAPPFSFTGIIR